MNKILFSVMLLVITRTIGFSQSVGIGTTTPDASSVLELKATNKGFLPPRMTAAEKALIPSPKAGLMIYQTDGVTGLYLYNGSEWDAAAGTATAFGWALNGNSGTNPSSNFIGTRDNQPLKLRVNNIPSGEINHINGNIALGPYALVANTSGVENTAIGYNSLNKNTTGMDNTSVGIGALFNNTTGRDNTVLGKTVMVSNVSGNSNLAAGAEALYSNVSGSSNVALGNRASNKSVDAGNIIAIGDSALYNNVMSYNVAIGSRALRSNTSGVSNTAIGADAMYNNLTGNQNTALGRTTLFNNTTGIQNTALGQQAARYNQSGNANTAVGFQSLLFNTANNYNTAVGNGSLANTISDNNTAVGHSALNDNTVGFSNTAIGFEALGSNTTGNYNTGIGYRAGVWGTGFINATAIGANAQAGCSDCVVLGSVNGYNGATANSKVGVGTISPQKTLHVNPNGQGGISIGNDLVVGGYTALNMGISQASGGYGFIQGVKATASTPTWGDLVLNQSGGNVGIRKTAPLSPLHIKQSTDQPPYNGGLRLEKHDDANYWDISVDFADHLEFGFKGNTKVRFSNTDGDIWTVSDLRMKKDIQLFETALPRLMKLEAKSYHYKDNENSAPLSYGFIAQEVEKIFPEAVATMGRDGMKAVGYQKLNILAIKAIQEQQVIIEEQNKRITALETKMEQLLKGMVK